MMLKYLVIEFICHKVSGIEFYKNYKRFYKKNKISKHEIKRRLFKRIILCRIN